MELNDATSDQNGAAEPPQHMEEDLSADAVKVIEILSRFYKIKISIRYKVVGKSGLWIIQTMDKSFRHERFSKAIALMAKFVYYAHITE